MTFENASQLNNELLEKQEENEQQEKELKLEEIRQKVEGWADALGKGIDDNIKETVTMFTANELPTSDSCEGHVGHGLPTPYIEISASDKPETRFVGEEAVFEKVAKKYGVPVEDVERARTDEAYWEAMKECSQNGETEEYKKWEKKNAKLTARAEKLLEEFYKNRKVDSDIKLEIDKFVGGSRIHSGGESYENYQEDAWSEKKFTEEEKEKITKKIEEYRTEMNEFTKFLKNKYFSE